MEYKGSLTAKGMQYALVVSEFNSLITERLLSGAIESIRRHGGSDPDIFWVSGALELASVARRLVKTKKYQGVACLGAIIKGDTDHYDYICSGVSSTVASVAKDSDIPVIFGVLTTHTVEAALNRAGIKSGNAGYAAALTMIEMASLHEQIDSI